MSLDLYRRKPDSEKADCYWIKWPYLEVTTPDYISGRGVEARLMKLMRLDVFGDRPYRPTRNRRS